ncbi:MAG: PEP-CTERM sorting domain-containing protein [Acidobacteria bacterium]|nr:PEP-CTERM sorting domain-containing protein [Acidobacteriota bacterium]
MKHLTLILLWAASLTAAPVLTITPAGAASGTPGATVGWGFSLTPDDTEWITVIASFVLNESNASLGVYSDLIGSQGGPAGGVLPPSPQPAWSQDFDPGLFTGLGSYTIDPLAVAGAINSGTIRVLYERYSDDPTQCGDCYIDSAEWDLAFSVAVDDTSVPEPGSWALIATGAAAIAIRRMRYHAPHAKKDSSWACCGIGSAGRRRGDAAGAV